APVDGHVLADRVPVPYLDPGRLAPVFLVLRRAADRGELENAIAPADARMALDHDVRPDPAALPDFDMVADDRIRTDLHVGPDPGAGMHDCGRVDRHGAGFQACTVLRTEQSISASQTTAPSTRAVHENFHTPRTPRSRITSSSSWSPGTTGRLKRALSMPAR